MKLIVKMKQPTQIKMCFQNCKQSCYATSVLLGEGKGPSSPEKWSYWSTLQVGYYNPYLHLLLGGHSNYVIMTQGKKEDR